MKRDPEIKEFNPLALWDLHYVKEIDDSGYIRKLYSIERSNLFRISWLVKIDRFTEAY